MIAFIHMSSANFDHKPNILLYLNLYLSVLFVFTSVHSQSLVAFISATLYYTYYVKITQHFYFQDFRPFSHMYSFIWSLMVLCLLIFLILKLWLLHTDMYSYVSLHIYVEVSVYICTFIPIHKWSSRFFYFFTLTFIVVIFPKFCHPKFVLNKNFFLVHV